MDEAHVARVVRMFLEKLRSLLCLREFDTVDL